MSFPPQYPPPPVAPYPDQEPNPTFYLIISVLMTLTCCQILGIIGIVFSILGISAQNAGDHATAVRHTATARMIVIIGLILGALSVCAGLLFFILQVGVVAAAGA